MSKKSLVDLARQQAETEDVDITFILTQLLPDLADRIESLERRDREAAEFVESVICMRTGFTGNPPYVGWKGLGLAISEVLDERDNLRAQVSATKAP